MLQIITENSYIIALASFLFFIISIMLSVLVIIKLPKDYWTNYENKRINTNYFLKVMRNILAVPIFVLGILLLFLPGQGILTILVSFVISDIPLKKKIIFNLIRREKIQHGFDRIRSFFGKEKFNYPE